MITFCHIGSISARAKPLVSDREDMYFAKQAWKPLVQSCHITDDAFQKKRLHGHLISNKLQAKVRENERSQVAVLFFSPGERKKGCLSHLVRENQHICPLTHLLGEKNTCSYIHGASAMMMMIMYC